MYNGRRVQHKKLSYRETVRSQIVWATLESETAAYFEGLTSQAAAEEADLEGALSEASRAMQVDEL